jgi:hypothetical protein
MPRPTRQQQLAILQRRKRVAEYYLRGMQQWEIAEREGVSHDAIYRDLQALRQLWLDSGLRDFDALKAEQLARIDRIETVAWEAWERSCQDAQTRTERTYTEAGAQQTDTTLQTKRQAGDPRFLERVGWCVEQRLKIIGAYAAEKHEHSLTVEQRRTRLAGILASLRQRSGTGGDGGGVDGLAAGQN